MTGTLVESQTYSYRDGNHAWLIIETGSRYVALLYGMYGVECTCEFDTWAKAAQYVAEHKLYQSDACGPG